VTSVAGAAFSKITYAPTPSINPTRIAYVYGTAGLTNTMYISKNDGSNPHVVPSVLNILDKPSWSRDGRLAISQSDTTIFLSQIYIVNSDGTNLHKISTGNVNDDEPAWSPDNFHIAFRRRDVSNYHIYVMTANGGSVTQLTNAAFDDGYPYWSADGSQIYFTRFNGSTHEGWRMNANGSSPVGLLIGNDNLRVAVSPNSNSVMVTTVNSSVNELILYPLPLASGRAVATDATVSYMQGTWSPDGQKVVYSAILNGTTSEIGTMNFDGTSKAAIISSSDALLADASWEPYPLPMPFISATGGSIFGTTASGFLFAMKGDEFCSFLTFTATTPSTATVTLDPVMSPTSNLIYHLNADAITSVKFMNSFGGAQNTVALTAGVKQVLISYNANTGFVEGVLPVAKTGSAKWLRFK